MAEPCRMRAPTHYLRVDLRDPEEAEYWLVVLDAARPQVAEAIAAVGADALDVAGYLRARRSRREPAGITARDALRHGASGER